MSAQPGAWRVAPGRWNALSDVEGIEVGHATRDSPPSLTGTTVVLARAGARAAVDVRGAAPATRETDALSPENLVDEAHGVLLSGGSAFGLAAADGVMRFLEEQGVGRRVGASPAEVVPIVPAAALFDLGRGGDFRARPDAASGYEAAAAASRGPVAEGNVGAGTGALFGGRRLKGGVGTASALSPLGTVAALVVLNAVGSAVDPRSGRLWGADFALGDELGSLGPATSSELEAFGALPLADTGGDERASGGKGERTAVGGHTVIGVVATDVALEKAECQRLARVAHDGLARAVRPSHTLFDGDVLFALSTGRRDPVPAAGSRASPSAPGRAATAGHGTERGAALLPLYELAADCVARSVARAVLAARSVGGHLAYRDVFPSVFDGR